MNISKDFCFEAAHILPRHPGKCSRLHGHSWKLTVTVFGPVQKETGFVLDYSKLKEIVQPLVDRFDHSFLNAFVRYPSSENIAIHIAHQLRPKLMMEFPNFTVAISETAGTRGEWNSSVLNDMLIFDAALYDSFSGAMDAEWRSPAIYGNIYDFPTAIAEQERALHLALESLTKHSAQLEQLRLFHQSLGKPGQIFEELKALETNNSNSVRDKA